MLSFICNCLSRLWWRDQAWISEIKNNKRRMAVHVPQAHTHLHGLTVQIQRSCVAQAPLSLRTRALSSELQ